MALAMKIAVFGGTFNPIHLGHIHLALAFHQKLQFDKILLIPANSPPHKEAPDLACAADRLEMCRLAAESDPVFEVDDIEIRSGGVSYTADTLAKLREQYPGAEWYLIMGSDMFLTFEKWRRYREIMEHCVLCSAARENGVFEKLCEQRSRLQEQGATVRLLQIDVMEVSSTFIRACVMNKAEASAYLNKDVSAYIAAHGLYQGAYTARIDSFLRVLRQNLGEKRFCHSLCVAQLAVELACRHGADMHRAYIAGLLHDVVKDLPPEELLQMMTQSAIILDRFIKKAPPVWHAIAGGVYLERVLGIHDEEIIHAVRYHTTARAQMSRLEKIIYLADAASADRRYPGVEALRAQSFADLDGAMLASVSFLLRDMVSKQKYMLQDTVEAYNWLLMNREENP